MDGHEASPAPGPHPGAARDLAYSPDGACLAAVSAAGPWLRRGARTIRLPPEEMPDVPPPEDCIPRERGIAGLDRDTDSTWAVTDSPFDNRFVEDIWNEDYRRPLHHVWFRLRDPGALPGHIDQIVMQAIAAYYADDTIMDNALFPHGWHRCWSELQTASLDHAMWFHRPMDLRRWHLFAQDSPVASGGRAMTRGTIFDDRGAVVASAAQEILLREPPDDKP